jgi:uncharacterized protein YdcH (DUF465 family)
MHLKQYPNAIAAQQTALMELRQTITQLKATISGQELVIERAIAFDPELKNDNQRKTKRAELAREDAHFQQLQAQLNNLDNAREQAEINLNLLVNKFAIAKLEKRQTIAQMEIEARLAS